MTFSVTGKPEVSPNVLAGRHRWLTTPSSLAVAIGALVAVMYAIAAIDFPPATGAAYGVILLVVGLITHVVGELFEQARLVTVRQLGSALIAPMPKHLEAAAHEVVRAPDTSFWVVLVGFSMASVTSAGLWWLVARPPAPLAWRAGLVGVLIAPLTAMAAHVVMLPRARALVRVLVSAGLPVGRLYSSLEPDFVLRSRLMVYAAIVVLTPMALVIETSLHQVSGQAAGGLPVLEVVVVLIIGGCGSLAGHALGAPMRALADETERLARGDYGTPGVVPSEFEIWGVARALAMMETGLFDAMQQLAETTHGISKTTDALVVGSTSQREGLAEQTTALRVTAATTGELANSARQIAGRAKEVSALARQTLEVGKRGKLSAEAFASSMQQVRAANQAIADSVVRLNKRVQQVGKVVEFIDGIADKSDLLALNAELEGHKAGEVGRGFGEVAAQMRGLAESVMSSTREIGRLIVEIRDSSNAAVMATEAGVKATDVGFGLAHRVKEGLLDIVEFANHSSEATAKISASIEQQEASTDQLAGVMADILRETLAGAEGSKAMSATNDALAALAVELRALLEKLNVNSTPSSSERER